MNEEIIGRIVAFFGCVALVAVAVTCLVWPRKFQAWAIHAVDFGPAWMNRINPTQAWARRYVRDPFCIWHLRIVGAGAGAMALMLAHALLRDML